MSFFRVITLTLFISYGFLSAPLLVTATESSYASLTLIAENDETLTYILEVTPPDVEINAFEITLSTESPLLHEELMNPELFTLPKDRDTNHLTIRYVMTEATRSGSNQVLLTFANNSQKKKSISIENTFLYLADGQGTKLSE